LVAVELILVRHAEAENRESDDGSRVDPALTSTGRDQAVAVARWLAREPIDRIVSSPSRRARETAEPMVKLTGLEPSIDSRLCEIDPDASQYLSIEAERALGRERYRKRVAAYQADPRITALSQRVDEGLTDWAQRTPGGRVVVFCHGGVVNVFTRLVLGMTPGILFEAQNASCHRFLVSSRGVRSVRSLNEVAYLSLLAPLVTAP
jgi:2,3-bisphosphoglycerate-dependent phosphoglycerate mutase